MDNERLACEFLDYLELTGFTVDGSLKSKLRKYLFFLDSEGLKATEITVRQAQSFQGYLLEARTEEGKPLTKRTVARRVTVASSFCNYLKTAGKMASNPFEEIIRVRQEKKLPHNVLKEKEVVLLLDELSKHYTKDVPLRESIKRYRIHVLCELLYSTGIRIGEAATLKLQGVDLKRGAVNIIDKKSRQARWCFLNTYAKEVLSLYINRTREWTFTEDNFKNKELLFGTKAGSLRNTTNKVLDSLTVRLNLPHTTCHSFRHAFAYHLLRAGCDIRYIQILLGHNRLSSTQIYTKVDKESLRDVLDKFHPRRFKRNE
jgi:site-specific recombinase XerD